MFKFAGCRKYIIEGLFLFVLITTCLFNIVLSPYCMCAMEACDEHEMTAVLIRVKTVLPRTVAVVCLVIRAKTMLHSANGEFRKYENMTREYEACFPDRVGSGVTFVASIVFGYAITVLPINAYRLYLIHQDVRNHTVTAFFVLMYAQNLCMCSTEIHYVARCFSLYRRFCQINEDAFVLKLATVTANRYPSVLLQSADGHRRGPSTAASGTRPTVGDVELLRMRHQCLRYAIGDLNDLYGVQLLLSLCTLCVMTLIDTYTEMFDMFSLAWSHLFPYVWLTQYCFRMCAIVLTTHFMMKQAYRTKMIVSDTNNRILDISTKEELYLFSNQILRRSMEFTTCDFFTLNAHFITSSIFAVITYFIVLFQYVR
ncbi:uncharacterized protein LOC111030274 [Myzus persicae]|uniref:uncharacterized protein LOC111030274 n=1 Tax=Myzus persicae TaxID=13164 RepID=UPI000B938B03|nr:uncharacterized protein LOC111030274 [Myzus persicae]